jgi:hypothetical protein
MITAATSSRVEARHDDQSVSFPPQNGDLTASSLEVFVYAKGKKTQQLGGYRKPPE